MKKLLALVAAIIVVVVVIWAITRAHSATPSPSTTPTPATSPTQTTPPTAFPTAAAMTIKYNSSGFSPSSITIKSGDSVTFENDSNSAIQVDSNPHPTHTDNSELNVGIITAGQSATVTLTRTGTWGYHNHLRSSDGGHITVQ